MMRSDLAYLTNNNNAERKFNDFYSTTKIILRGSQSTIKHVIHKESLKHYAVKIFIKKKMNEKEMEKIKSEIAI